MHQRRGVAVAGAAVAALLFGSSCGTSEPSGPFVDFVVAVTDETFVLRVADPETISAAYQNLRGANSRFPIGPLRQGDGGFNEPWSWHIDPGEVRLTEVAIELCDGRPSYVEDHVDDYLAAGYCPWGGRIVAVRP
ncbi:MAG TPA: hypothetical protein VFM88_01570 [Vicinamibacteria bacterium]|nr:hypothetical protein [Vicinamibacteria bacterium]